MNPPHPPFRTPDPNDSPEPDLLSVLPEIDKLDSFYRSRKEAGDLQTTEIPISMLMALNKLAKLSEAITGEDEESEAAPQGKSPRTVREMSGHLKRVAAYARLLALKYGMPEQEAKFVKQISPMHDIGKWAIPEAILEKPSALTPEEWGIMKTHTWVGYEMLKDSKLKVLQMGALVAIQHQEKFDGTGYPGGLKGEEIHIYSRITTVADVFDALGSERSYKSAWPVEDIIRYFQEGRGTHFDPRLVDLLLEHLDEFLAIRDSFPPAAKS